jgi:uncharacterized protein YbjT (DUF2867 family)
MKTILLAGATGALGSSILRELNGRGHQVRALVRNPARLAASGGAAELVVADVRRPETLAGACDGIDTVISTVGAPLRMGLSRRGESFRAVDYGGNMNLLAEVRRAGVRRFIYISLFNGEKMGDLEYARAHEEFARELTTAGDIESVVIRPTGFFSAFVEIFKMARRGRAMSVGNGSARTNPVHDDDIAIVCADAIDGNEREIAMGGPMIYTRREITEMAFAALGKRPNITSVHPGFFRAMLLPLRLIDRRLYDLFAFFAEVGVTEVVAPVRGTRTLEDYFRELASRAR